MTELDRKIREIFPNESLYKSPNIQGLFAEYNLPSFIRDWLTKRFTADNGEIDTYGLKRFLEEHIPDKSLKLKGKIMSERKQMSLLTRIIVEPDVLKNQMRFSAPDLGLKSSETQIPWHVVDDNKPYLLGGETWGVITLTYVYPSDGVPGHFEMIGFRPFQPYIPDLDYFKDCSKHFEVDEWIDVLIRGMEYNPAGFTSFEQKLLFISRLLPFVEPNLNLIELAPKGTGKSYLFSNISKYGWVVSGGKITRAQLFYNVATKQPGIITRYDVVALDEVESITFGDNESELQGALKNYLESGKFTVAGYSNSSSAGLVLLGNLELDEYKRPVSDFYLSALPEFFQESALLDRFHGFIEGWKLPRIREDMKLNGYGFNVEYFSEILHLLRKAVDLDDLANSMLNVPRDADTRDTRAVKRIAAAFLKLLKPHATKDNLDPEFFRQYCLEPAMRMRQIVRKQASLIDKEFSPYMPNITVRGLS
ncbi:BREX system Lon protease-like protein BrxL [Coprothermobacteraceae bacterium]|nr:BREX system Lon protease-like protein BrxL [Coprothermobacteraceae bacterium]